MKSLSLIFIALFALNTWAADLNQEMDALGANQDLIKKAKAIDANNRVRVVQNREVDRHWRIELGLNYGMDATGGDPYVNTSSLGAQADLHINPHFSVGARYYNYNNSLNSEGKSVYNDAAARIANGDTSIRLPQVDYAKDSMLGVVNWYPIYGKMNLLDLAITQFDVYLLGGAGVIQLGSGSSSLYTAGAGVGLWFTKHVASRLEARWQGYEDHVYDGSTLVSRQQNETVMTASISFLL